MEENGIASKSEPLVGLVLSALAALLIAGVASFAGPCGQHAADLPSCVWAARAVLAIGAVAAVLAIVRIFERDEGERRGLSLGCSLLGFLAAAIPAFVIALCQDPAMPCNAHLRPFVAAVGLAIGIVGAADLTWRLLKLIKI